MMESEIESVIGHLVAGKGQAAPKGRFVRLSTGQGRSWPAEHSLKSAGELTGPLQSSRRAEKPTRLATVLPPATMVRSFGGKFPQ